MWVLKIGRVIVNETTLKFPNTLVLLAILVYLTFKGTGDLAIREGLRKGNLKRKRIKVKVCVYPVLVESYMWIAN